MLQPPLATDEEFKTNFTRAPVRNYKNESERFKLTTKRRYDVQYSQLYFTRLHLMKPRLQNAARKKWGDDILIRDLKDLVFGEECCIIGTVFKRMDFQPNTLKQISDNHHLLPHPVRMKCTSDNDDIMIEDAIQRITLNGISGDHLVTGLIIAVRGSENTAGKFDVIDYCFAGLAPLSTPPINLSEDSRYVMLMSGLNIGSEWTDQLSISLLVDYISGQLGDIDDQSEMAKASRVIIAGNSVTDQPIKSKEKENKMRYSSRNYSAESIESMKELDIVLTQLTSCISVDIMPGSHDPVNNQLPQQPLHHCMFPLSSKYDTLISVTNPYEFIINGIKFLGTSGQNIDNLYCYTNGLHSLDLLESTLYWSHIAPTVPDTLCCYPYNNDDPFIISESPHVYFVGNQPYFQTKQISGGNILMICIPIFDISHSCVLVDLQTLTCKEIKFKTSLKHKYNPNTKNIELLQTTTIQDIDYSDNDES